MAELSIYDPKFFGPSRIYFIRVTDFIKIGQTGSVTTRLSQIQTANPHTVTLLYAFPGDEETEELLHLRFEDHHHRGEWFHAHEDILSFIESHKNDPSTPIVPERMFRGVEAIDS